MNLESNTYDIQMFLCALSLETEGLGYYEVRMLHPDPISGDATTRARSRWFSTDFDGIDAATDYIAQWNAQGFNAYVTPNILYTPVNKQRAARDDDVICWAVHVVDADREAMALAERLSEFSFPWSFCVITGTEPEPRMQVYWRLNDFSFDLAAGRTVQQRLAATFGTDPAVCNPSRVMRVGGSISYPSAGKRARGYRTELTTLEIGSMVNVDQATFYAAFPAPASVVEPVPTDAMGADTDPRAIPAAVIAAALDAIPPVTCHGERTVWLRVAYACKDAGQRALFDAWQRRSPLWRPADAHVWNTVTPTPNSSFVALIALAKQHNPDWWRTDAEAEDWFIERARQHDRITTTALERWNNRIASRLHGKGV